MIKNFLRELYYFFYDILISVRNFNKDKNFVIIFPRLISKFIKRVLIYDKINKNFFLQNIRNKYDILTVFEIFAQESYMLNKLDQWEIINKKYLQIISNEKKPLFIEGLLEINEGTTLRFSQNSYMIVKGSIKINGSNKKPVKMTSINKNSTWKGLYVFNEKQKKQFSQLKSLKVFNTRSTQIGLLDLTGGITFYNTKIFC